MQLARALDRLLQDIPQSVPFDPRFALLQRAGKAVEITPLAALEHDRVGRMLDRPQRAVEEPREIATGQVAVAEIEKMARHQRLIVRDRLTRLSNSLSRQGFGAHHHAQHRAGLTTRAGHDGRQDRRGPEMTEAAHSDQHHQPDHHDQ